MSSLFVHVGQCGNQIALPFWRLAESEAGLPWGGDDGGSQSLAAMEARCRHPLFDDVDGCARCVMVDSEPKVVADTVRGLRTIRPGNVCLDHSGRGNNWAMGFMACAADEERAMASSSHGIFGSAVAGGLFCDVVETIRREAERTDALRSMVVVHSLSGGTGSGAGSAILQHLRDYYPACWLLPVA